MVLVPEGDWISVRQAADLIGVTKRTILNYIDLKLVDARDVDGFWLVLRSDVAKLKRPGARPKRGRPKASD
jgi:hypothetical protein